MSSAAAVAPAAPPAVATSAPVAVAFASVPPGAVGAPQPSHTASHTAVCDQFIASDAVQQLYADAVSRYITLHDQLHSARSQLDKFKEACNRSAPRVSLPKSMQLRLVDSAHFTAVDGQPAFYADDITALRAIEEDATARIITTVTAAKEKHIVHLTSRVNQLAFTTNEQAVYAAFLQEHAAGYEASVGPGAFPTAALLAHFAAHLHSHLTGAALTASMKLLEQRKHAAAAAAADRDTQESVMLQGAHDGKIIAAVAAKIVDQKLDPLQRLLQSLKNVT